MNKNQENKALRLEMVEVNQSRFAAEILSGNASINLTQMAKPFGKIPKDWLRTEEAKRYIKAISVGQKCLTADLVEVRNGGRPENQGTWCKDYRIALRFAQWLSPEFSVMVDEAILRLLSGKRIGVSRHRRLQWVTLNDEREVAEFFGVSRHHVHEVLMGRRPGYAVLAALTSHGSENRKQGIRRPNLSPEATARKTRQLALEFANETKEG